MHQCEALSKDQKLTEVTKEFDNYRRLNDLDYYFTKNLDSKTRERLLENIRGLMQKTDWHTFDRSVAQMLQPAETKKKLEQVIQLSEQAKTQVEIDEKQRIEDDLFEENREAPPMTAKVFNHRFNQDLELKVIKQSVDQAREVAQRFV